MAPAGTNEDMYRRILPPMPQGTMDVDDGSLLLVKVAVCNGSKMLPCEGNKPCRSNGGKPVLNMWPEKEVNLEINSSMVLLGKM